MAVGDVAIFEDSVIALESNTEFIRNAVQWLAFRNCIDIESLKISSTVEFENTGTVEVILKNSCQERISKIKATLQSDSDAIIEDPVRERLSVPPERITEMHWNIAPRRWGEQQLRLEIAFENEPTLFFDQFPEMRYVAPGYLTLEIRDQKGALETAFHTGDYFTVEGTFHTSVEHDQLPHVPTLKLDDGLIEAGYEPEKSTWLIKAVEQGVQTIRLEISETGQILPAVVSVTPSTQDRVAKLYTAYVTPFDAEIAERLQQVDERFVDPAVRNGSFKILPPNDYVEQVYSHYNASWIQGILTAAHREQWFNLDLLNLIFKYVVPTYFPNKGTFIPYGPDLASRLARLHSAERKHLEYNLLSLEDSERSSVKQNIAAYLLHEKYGHGFFYTQTLLGRQIALLEKNNPIDDRECHEAYRDYQNAAHLIRDSSVIANEGFGAWMELTFLRQMTDPDVRQAANPREKFLIIDAEGLFQRFLYSDFFENFPPRFDSAYREGFEYLEFIGKEYNFSCAVQAFLLATQIDFGISSGADGQAHFSMPPKELEHRLLDKEDPTWHSHVRLRQIAEVLFEYKKEIPSNIRKQYGLKGVHDKIRPLQELINEKLQWRA